VNRRIVLPLVFVLVVILFSGVESASSDGNVGVSVGQISEYTFGFSGTARYSDGTLNASMPFYVEQIETNTIQEVSGTNITVRCVRDMLNGSKTVYPYWVDVSTGDGTAWGVVISADISAGDMIYPDWVNENLTTAGAFIINETILLKYGDENIEANHVQLSFKDVDELNYYDYHYYWDKSTGLLLKYFFLYIGIDEEDGMIRNVNTHFQKVGLQQIFYPLIDSTDYPVTVDSKSAIVGFEFNQTERQLSLNVTGTTGTSGYCDVTVPSNLLWGTFSLNMDGYPLVEGTDYTQTSSGTDYIFHIAYIHSSHTIDIVASGAIPDEPETTEPEPTETETTEPEPTEPTEAPFITTEVAIIVAVAVAAVIGVVVYWTRRKQK
jgi:hypothetical protein